MDAKDKARFEKWFAGLDTRTQYQYGLETSIAVWHACLASTSSAKPMSPEAEALDEAAVTYWLSEQIEDGHIDVDRLPLLMARYALADPQAMREELAERMHPEFG